MKKQKPAVLPMTEDEHRVWDGIVMTLIGNGMGAQGACLEATTVICARRKPV